MTEHAVRGGYDVLRLKLSGMIPPFGESFRPLLLFLSPPLNTGEGGKDTKKGAPNPEYAVVVAHVMPASQFRKPNAPCDLRRQSNYEKLKKVGEV